MKITEYVLIDKISIQLLYIGSASLTRTTAISPGRGTQVAITIMTEPHFHLTTMPSSRPADYCLGYLDSCVFIDFNNFGKEEIILIRISFDGYGCCNLGDAAIPLPAEESGIFKNIIQADLKEQDRLLEIVKSAIALNKDLIWADALEAYNLV